MTAGRATSGLDDRRDAAPRPVRGRASWWRAWWPGVTLPWRLYLGLLVALWVAGLVLLGHLFTRTGVDTGIAAVAGLFSHVQLTLFLALNVWLHAVGRRRPWVRRALATVLVVACVVGAVLGVLVLLAPDPVVPSPYDEQGRFVGWDPAATPGAG